MNRRKGKYPRKIIALIASFVLVVGLIPVPAIASGGTGNGPEAAAEAPSAAPGAESPLAPPDDSTPGASEQPSADEPEAPGANAAPGEAPGKAGGVDGSGQVDTNGIGDAKAEGPDTGGEKARGEAAGADGPEAPATPVEPAQAPFPAFCESSTVDGVTVTVEADAGAFPEGARLSVAGAPSSATEAAIAPERGAGANVAASYTFDIKVLDADGAELQPADGKSVRVSFKAAEVADPNLDVSVYHVPEGASGAEELGVDVSGATATAESGGFSYYTVEFTYGDLQYVLQGGGDVPLADVLAAVGLQGEPEAVEVSDPALFSASNETGEWVVTSHKAFSTDEWMRVAIAGKAYEIKVTDDQSGTCGENLTWTLTGEGNNLTLTISGTGAMYNYGASDNVPWHGSASSITSVVIGDGVTSVGDFSFDSCTSLAKVSIPSSVTSIGVWAFYKCSALKGIDIPASVTNIGTGAFFSSGLTSVRIPASVTTVGSGAFDKCTALGSVVFQGAVESIGYGAFSYCTGLGSVVFQGAVGSIGDGAFLECAALGSVVFQGAVGSMAKSAFQGCSSWNDVYCYGTSSQFESCQSSNWGKGGSRITPNPHYTQYAVTASSSDENHGSSKIEWTWPYQNKPTSSATLTATPAEGYHFASWTKGGTVVSRVNPYSLTATENAVYVANFEPNSANVISVAVDPTAGGSVTGGGTYAYKREATLNATPSTGYHFVNWTEDGTPVSTDASYSFTVTGARNLVAHFDLDTFTISLTADPENGGTVSGAGTHQYGSSVSCEATPSTGYHFVNWTENGTEVSTSATYEFYATADRALVAHFELDTFNVSATTDPEVGGTVSGGGTFAYGQKATLTAEPSEGYVFDYWSTKANSETPLCKTEEYEFNVTGSEEYVAHFKKILIVEADGKQPQSQTYTGSAITFPIKVYLEGVDEALIEGADYKAEFKDNVNVGKGKIVVELTSSRQGTATATFDIVAADISTATVKVADQVYDGTEQKPAPTVTWGNKAVGADDYTANYADNVRAGTASVVVEGKRNFTETSKASGTFKIAKRPATVTADSAERVYDGKPLTADGFTSEGLAEGDMVASAKVEGSQTDVGSSANKVSGAKIVNAAGEDVTDCYDIAYKDGTLTVKPGEGGAYVPAEGSGQAWAKGSTEALTFAFKSATGDDGRTFELFEGVEVDGKAVPEKDASGKANWKAERGSLILSLQPAFLETLSDGEHTVTALFGDGAGEASFEVTAAKAPGAPAAGTDDKTTADKAADSKDTTSKKTPRTGDVVGGATGVIAVLAAALVMASRRRRHVLGGRPGGKRG